MARGMHMIVTMLPRGSLTTFPSLIALLGFTIFLYQNHQITLSIRGIRDQLDRTRSPSSDSVLHTKVKEIARPVLTTAVPDPVKLEMPSYSLERVASVGSSKQTMSKDDLDALKLKLFLMTWPSLTGYDNRFVTPEKNGIDAQLFDRIVLHQRVYPQPLFKVKKEGVTVPRHEWQFEKIIHQTWIDEQIPGRTAPWVKKWLEMNPDWTYMFWSDKAAHDFIQEHYPSLLFAYESWSIPVQKADMFRYIVLYAFGGVYADLDMEVLRNISEIRNWSSCILSREPELQTFVMSNFMNCWGNNWTFTCNAFMACRSHHPFMHYVISRVVHWSPYIVKRPCSLSATISCTGPWMMSFSHTYYKRSVPEELRRRRKEIDVICPSYEFFLPTFDESRLKLVQRNCGSKKLDERQKLICKKYIDGGSKNVPLNYSFTTHHWFHSYHYNVNKDRVDVRTLTKVLQWTHDTQDADFDVSYPEA